jgi:biopolymer transport protein ExbD
MKKTRKSPVIDLTPLVDLGFLLLITFMVIHFYSKPRLMEMNMPDSGCGGYYDCYLIRESMVETLFLDKDNLYIQNGSDHKKDSLRTVTYKDLRRFMLNKQTWIDESKKRGELRPTEGAIYLIKPLPSSRYENMVDVLDEMTICDVDTYVIVDVLPHEKAMLAQR